MTGFSLVETLVTLLIISILAALSLPVLRSLFVHSNSRVIQSQLVRAIEFAEEAAEQKGIQVGMCLGRNSVCSKDQINELLVFNDEKNDGVISHQSQLLVLHQINIGKDILRYRAYPSYRHYMQFRPDVIEGIDNGTYWYCHENQVMPAWAVIVSKMGRVRIVEPDRNGIVKNAEGSVIKC